MTDASPGRPLRVALDVTPAFAALTGVARYGRELWRHLDARADVDVRALSVGWRGSGGDGRTRHLRVPLRVAHAAWRWTGRPRAEQLVGDIDVVHGTEAVAPPSRRPRVITIHDLLPITRPELFPDDSRRAAKRSVAAARRGADLVLATCDATADEIAEVCGIDRARVVAARPGVGQLPEPSATSPHATPYLLAVGGITPRKGYDVLAAAAAAVGPTCPPILVAGGDWWRAEEVKTEVRARDRHDALRFLGPVSDEDLATLYRHAALVCHPSRCEGFGFPCLEAMAAGVPVVASDLPSLREMGDGAMVLAPAGDADALAAGIRRLLDDDGERAALQAAGRQRAAAYTWDATADAVVAAYRTVLRP